MRTFFDRLRGFVGQEKPRADPVAGAEGPARAPMDAFPAQVWTSPNGQFPAIDWMNVWDWLESVPEDAWHARVSALQATWLHEVARRCGPRYALAEFPDLFVVSRLDANAAGKVAAMFQATRRRLAEKLPGMVSDEGYGKDVCLVLAESSLYYRYLATGDDDTDQAPSESVYLDDGCPQIVLRGTSDIAIGHLLVHETARAALAEPELPAWLSIGIALVMEEEVCGQLGAEHLGRFDFVAYFDRHGLDTFLDGAGFEFGGDAVTASYQLAYRLVRYLWTSDAFPAFVASAAAMPDTEAVEQHYGSSLEALCGQVCRPDAD